MLVDGFRWVPASLFYIVCLGLLSLHISHGFSSAFQTLGLTTKGTRSALDSAAKGLAAVFFVAYASIPLAVLLGRVH
jgi:succinate dehydrogenase / fumarate reductase cytochrome b subunit